MDKFGRYVYKYTDQQPQCSYDAYELHMRHLSGLIEIGDWDHGYFWSSFKKLPIDRQVDFLVCAGDLMVRSYIRSELAFDPHVKGSLRHTELPGKEHLRFEMSGYDGSTCGSCTENNIKLLNRFAYLGIYDYTYYLFLDFYKGTSTLYFRYWRDEANQEISFNDLGTVDIIHEIFKLTIFSSQPTRRR